jgi:predicted nucleic acid-binding protein
MKIAAAQLTIDQLVDGYAQLAALVRPVATPRIAPDPDDDVVIGTALAARAKCIVTGDKRLASVVRHQGVRLVSVAQALEDVETKGKA